MICKSCRKDITFSSAAKKSIRDTVARVESTAMLKIKCPHCSTTRQVSAAELQTHVSDSATKITEELERPPEPPRLNWKQLHQAASLDNARRSAVMIAVATPTLKVRAAEVFTLLDYDIVEVSTTREAAERLDREDFDSVILEESFDTNSLDDNLLHQAICNLPPDRRRTMMYIIVGAAMNTLYSLQAVTLSANVVIKTSDAIAADFNRFDIVVKRSISQLETDYAAYIQELQNASMT